MASFRWLGNVACFVKQERSSPCSQQLATRSVS